MGSSVYFIIYLLLSLCSKKTTDRILNIAIFEGRAKTFTPISVIFLLPATVLMEHNDVGIKVAFAINDVKIL